MKRLLSFWRCREDSKVELYKYARLLDDTKRKEFEKVVKQGVFSFDLNGQIHQVSESAEVPKDIIDMMCIFKLMEMKQIILLRQDFLL